MESTEGSQTRKEPCQFKEFSIVQLCDHRIPSLTILCTVVAWNVFCEHIGVLFKELTFHLILLM